jgi:hypothetical protein
VLISTKSIDEYFKEMKLAIMWANVEEDRKAIITRFIICLNRDIAHIMELGEMMHMVVKIERQFKWKGTVWQSQQLDPSKPWKPNWKANTEAALL